MVLPLVPLCLGLAGQGSSGEAPTVILVVRHAEKATDGGEDPPLREAGVQRAQALVEVAAEAGVTAIYSTPFRRTRETARPVAERLGLTVRQLEVESSDASAYARALAREVLSKHRGGTVLVVGHSNTVPLVVEALGGGSVPAIADDEYDRLFIVVVSRAGPARIVKVRYGACSTGKY